MIEPKKIIFHQGELHALALDADTIAVVLSREEATSVLAALNGKTLSFNERGYANRVAYALSQLPVLKETP